jgi:HK97 family phage portal protein
MQLRKSQASAMGAAVFSGRISGSSSYSVDSGMSFKQAVESGYKGLVWVHRCVTATGSAVGSVPWKAYKKQKDGKLIWLPNHPAERLIERPNPYYTRRELMEAWSIYLQLAGASFLEIVFVNNGKMPYQLFMLRPDWMTPVPDPISHIKEYRMDAGGGRKTTFEPHEIMHFKYLDPMNEYVGLSPLAAAARTIATEDAAIRWNKSIFDNSAVPNGVLKVPGTGLKKKERDELKGELEKEFTQDNLHRPMILWGGMEWEKMAMDAKDLDFLKQRELNKYEICAILECPPQIVGATVDPTYANYDVARTAWWEDGILTKLDWFQAKFNATVAPMFGDDIEVRYDISDVPAMRSSFKEKVDTSKTLWMMGYPINSINKRVGLGFEDVAWGNAWWAPMNYMPITSDEPSVDLTATPPTPPTKPPAMLPAQDDEVDDNENL